MSYIGRGTESISNVEVLDNLTFNGSASYTLQKSSVNFVPSSANNLLISISGVVQQGNFSVSGSTITFDTTVSGSDTCDWILHYGTGLITTVADGAITEAKLGSNAVTTAKINNGAITSAKLDSGLALGKIGQVVSATTSTAVTNSTTSYADIGLSVTITPTSTSSKIYINAAVTNIGTTSPETNVTTQHRILRDATEVVRYNTARINGVESDSGGSNALLVLDSPSTTSAITYKIQQRVEVAGGRTSISQHNTGASTIIAMEVLA